MDNKSNINQENKKIIKNCNNIDYYIILSIIDNLFSINIKYNIDKFNFINYEKKFYLNDLQNNDKYFLICENNYDLLNLMEKLIKNDSAKILNKKNNEINLYLYAEEIKNEIIICLPKIQNNVYDEINNLKNIIKDIYEKDIKNLEKQNKILFEENKNLKEEIICLKNILNNNKKPNNEKFFNNNLDIQSNNNLIENNIKNDDIDNQNKKKLLKKEKNLNKTINLQLIFEIKMHEKWISNIILLDDGRIASCSLDKKIIVYNLDMFLKDLIIKFSEGIYYLMKLKSYNNIVASSLKEIYLINIEKENYNIKKKIEINQILFKIIELSNNIVVGGGNKKELILFKNENNLVINKVIKKDGEILDIEEINNDVLFVYLLKKNALEFYNYKNNQIISSFEFNDCHNWHIGKKIYKLNNKYILVIGQIELHLINIEQYMIIKTIYDNSFFTFGTYKNKILISTGKGDIKECIISDNNEIKLYSIKTKAHNYIINCIFENNNNVLITGDNDGILKIWMDG